MRKKSKHVISDKPPLPLSALDEALTLQELADSTGLLKAKRKFKLNLTGKPLHVKYPYEELPDHWRGSVVLTKRKGIRWFEERGDKKTFEWWLKELHEKQPGNLLPLQWAADFIQLSRVAVLNRAKKGKLMVFSYIVTKPIQSLTGSTGNRQTRKRYDYVLISELLKWKEELRDKYGLHYYRKI